MRRRWSYLDGPLPLALAHRGAHGHGISENSMKAFEAAVALGYDYVETDVQATADGVLMVIHDPTLDRVTNRNGPLADMPYRQVAAARLTDGTPVPLLEDLLGSWPELRVNIDAKDDRAVGPLLDVLRRTRSHHRVCVGAFSTPRIRALRACLPPGTATALAPGEVAALRLDPPGPIGSRWLASDAPCVQVPVRYAGLTVVTGDLVSRAHEQGRQVHVWTVDDEAEMHRLLDLDVDGIVTDNSSGLLDVIAARRARAAVSGVNRTGRGRREPPRRQPRV